jgi:hypothetical protein
MVLFQPGSREKEIMAEVRPLRMCDACGQVDDHPRHVFGIGPDDGNPTTAQVAEKARAAADEAGGLARQLIEAQISDTTTRMMHMDCCRDADCPDGTCDEVTRGAEDKRGDDLVKHIVGGSKRGRT